MKVLFVINSIYTKGNGLATSARRTVRYLKEAGVDVRVLSAKNPDPNGEQPDFPLKEYTLPLIGFLVRKQGFAFAEINRDVIHEAVAWADVIHLEEPFDLEIAVAKEAIEQGVPMTATYHLHPENLFATAHLQNDPYFNRMTMRFWRNHVYNLCEIVQCPTENVRQRLAKWHYKAELRVISNGLTIEEGVPSPQQSDLTLSNAKYRIITIGRYSVEKDLITLLKSMKYSAFSQDIELVLAGRGPTEHTLKKYADKLYKKGVLRYPVQFGFFALPDLQKNRGGIRPVRSLRDHRSRRPFLYGSDSSRSRSHYRKRETDRDIAIRAQRKKRLHSEETERTREAHRLLAGA